jgi:2-methylcitrate dehydratase PrpD
LPTASEELASLAYELRLPDVPQEWVEKVKRHILDMLGVTLMGTTVPNIQPVRQYALTYGARGRSSLFGPKAEKLDAEDAALFNGTAGLATETDDHHLASIHPGCSIVPGCLAAAEDVSASGADFLRAVIMAYEVTNRVGMATTTSIVFDRGFVNSSVYNGFGVSVGAGLLLGLDDRQLVHALALAGAHASGVGSNGRTSVSRYGAGIPASNGIRAARLARLGLKGSPAFFEAPVGYFTAFTAHPKPELLTQDLGTEWIGIAGLRHKMEYSTTGDIAPQIEALLSILKANAIKSDQIKAIRVGMGPLMYKHTSMAPPPTMLKDLDDLTAANFAYHYQLGIAAVRGHNNYHTLLDLARGGFNDLEIMRVAGTVSCYLDSECEALFPEKWMTKVVVETHDGRSYEERAFAMTEPDVEEKLHIQLGPLLPPDRIAALVECVKSLETLGRIDQLTELIELPEPAS